MVARIVIPVVVNERIPMEFDTTYGRGR